MAPTQPQGHLATPAGGTGNGVLVLHAWWGLNDTIKAVCKRLADEGFIAFAPDLYHGKVVATIPEAEAMVKQTDERAHSEVSEATRFLAERSASGATGLAVVGFSMGAAYALDQSAADPENIRKVVVFYGTTGGVDFGTSSASYLGHFAEDDPFEERAYVDELEKTIRDAGRPVTFHHYPGTGHWFFEPDRTDAYNKSAADLAWQRTLEFLKSA